MAVVPKDIFKAFLHPCLSNNHVKLEPLSPYSLNSQIHFAFFKKIELLDSIECLMCCAYASCLFLFCFFFLVYHKPQHLCSAHFIWKDRTVLFIPLLYEWRLNVWMSLKRILLPSFWMSSAHTQHCYPFMTFLLCLQLFYWLLPMPIVFSQTISLVLQTLHSPHHVDPAFGYSTGLNFHSKDVLTSTNHSLLLSLTKFIFDTHLQCLKNL